MSIICTQCKEPKRPDEMRAGKPHCKACRNAKQNTLYRQRAEAAKLPYKVPPRTHIGTGRYETTPVYYRNDGLKNIPSRGLPT